LRALCTSRSARLTARALTWLGAGLTALGVVLAIIAFMLGPPDSQSPDSTVADSTRTALGLLVSGFLAGMPLIVVGQVIHLLLEQRRLLRQIVRELRAGGKSASPVKSPNRPPIAGVSRG
jgi:hypothetical protein